MEENNQSKELSPRVKGLVAGFVLFWLFIMSLGLMGAFVLGMILALRTWW